MEERDPRRSPSLERLLKRRPSFSRPPIRTIHSPRLTEDEAEMLTSPFLSYRTKYTYAQSACYNPELPSSWEVPNLALAGVEINAPLSYIHVASPSLLYICWSYILWIFELIAYFTKKIIVTVFKEVPTSLLVLLYDIACYIYYGGQTVIRNALSFVQTFLFGNALHQGTRSASELLQKLGYFLLSAVLLPVSGAYWLLDKTGKGVYSIWDRMSGLRYNLRPYRPRASAEADHVRFSPDPDVVMYNDNNDDNISTTSTKRRSIRPVHNLRNRMITEVVTDSEDEGFSEKQPYTTAALPRSALKTNGIRRKLSFENEQPKSKAMKIAHFLGSIASTFVSGIYWLAIEVLTVFNRCIYAYNHRIRNMFTWSHQNENVPIMHTRRSTRRRTSSVDSITDGPQSADHSAYNTWSSKFVTGVFYPLAVAYNFIAAIFLAITRFVLAGAFALVDICRFFKNHDANIFLFGGAKTGVEGETENIESLCVHPLTAAGEKVYSVALLPLSLMHWVGIKTINGLKALGDKRKLIWWLLPLLLLLLILLSRRDDHYPRGLGKNAEEIKAPVSSIFQSWTLFDPEGVYVTTMSNYYVSAQEKTSQFADRAIVFVSKGTRGVWNIVSRGLFGLWSTAFNLCANVGEKFLSIISSIWAFASDAATSVWHFVPSSPSSKLNKWFREIGSGFSNFFHSIGSGIIKIFHFVRDFLKQIAVGIWNGLTYAVLFIWNALRSVALAIYNFVMAVWNFFVDFLVILIDIWRAFSKKIFAIIPKNVSLPDTGSIKQTLNYYYEAVPSVSFPTMPKLSEAPELPLQFYPSYYKDYVPSTKTLANSFWTIITIPQAVWNYMITADTKNQNVLEKTEDIPIAPLPPREPEVRVVQQHIYHPAPKVEIDEAKIIQEILAKLTLPKVDESKIIQEVTSRLAIPKVDEERIITEITEKLQTEMGLKIKALEASYKKSIDEINFKHTNVELDYSHLEALIRKAIYQYDADKTGLFDFALESAGASVISTRCSESYNSYSRLEKIWNIPLWYSSYGPRTVIQRNSNSLFPGECWSFKSGTGYLTIDLSHKINISSISYEHIGADQAPDNNRTSAPKTFKFWAYKTEDDIKGRFLLGTFEYKLDGHPLQFFVIKNQPNFPVKIVEMEVTSNYGAEFTCLYRLRVHGQIYKTA